MSGFEVLSIIESALCSLIKSADEQDINDADRLGKIIAYNTILDLLYQEKQKAFKALPNVDWRIADWKRLDYT